ncbi:MAG: hypothetical protein KKE86_15595 [Planctomycetes bacterium]|nr:hypothetical protein [Planctomycetota bacterium]MBU4400740.1 hypothetical protein [Planctomycetota bacterium]MCG2685162.1 hypothetical protein [Planctomycetales bacterium]
MKLDNLLGNARGTLLAALAVLLSVACGASANAGQINEPAVKGSYYEAEVPDTLDLAERGRWGLDHFLAIMRDDRNYEMPLIIAFRPEEVPMAGSTMDGPMVQMHGNSLGACQPKAMEAMAFLRLMTGSTKGLDREAKMADMMLSMFGKDGLHWVPGSSDKRWIPEPFVMVHGQGRILRAMNAWYQYTGNRVWLDRINGLIDGIDKIVEHKGDYAYFPVHGRYEGEYLRSCYVREGWKDTVEPPNEKFGEEGSLFNHQGHVPGGMAASYSLSNNDKALRLSGELVRFLTKPKLWADWEKGDYPMVAGPDHAHWHGHWHGHINTLRAILDYAVAVNDPRLMLFAREGYEWARQKNLGRIGFFEDQGCAAGRTIGLAVKLSYYGIGDYWEDVDLYIRNHGIEMQIVPEDMPYLRKLAGKNLNEETEKVLAKCVGAYAGRASKNCTFLCCSPHGNMGVFYAWDGTLRYRDGVAQVNLLLNRASPWMDVDSYLPYEGKVVLKNKEAREALVRIPLWVDKKSVRCRVDQREAKNTWFGQYLRFTNLEEKDIITIEFPMVERTELWTMETHGRVRTCRFKGNTLIEISPMSPQLHPAALYGRRQDFLKDKAPMRKVTRYVTPLVLKW